MFEKDLNQVKIMSQFYTVPLVFLQPFPNHEKELN